MSKSSDWILDDGHMRIKMVEVVPFVAEINLQKNTLTRKGTDQFNKDSFLKSIS